MKFVNIHGRSHIEVAERHYVDVERASGGRLPSDPKNAIEVWQDLVAWNKAKGWSSADIFEAQESDFGPPVPMPGQIFAVGLNYSEHAKESRMVGNNSTPLTFTKFRSSVCGPQTKLSLPTNTVDWEIELVVVIGRSARCLSPESAWDAVAGLTLGQDISERTLQMAGSPPQFSLGKSYPGFAPIGPALVTLDEFDDPTDIDLICDIDGEVVQSGNTRDLTYGIPELIAHYSAICTLSPGDLIFTGTPEGVGMGRKPERYLQAGEVLTSRSPRIGRLVQTCVKGTDESQGRVE